MVRIFVIGLKKQIKIGNVNNKTMVRKFKHLKTGIIGTNDSNSDYFLHFERGDDSVVSLESISMDFIVDSNDWVEILEPQKVIKPTNWFDTKQIETWIGLTDNGVNSPEELGGRAKLIILHQCGENKDILIDQLKTMIDCVENDGMGFGS